MGKFSIEALLQENGEDMKKVVGELTRGRLTALPPVSDYIKQLDPKLHDVMNQRVRPDKIINVDPTSESYGTTRSIMTDQDYSDAPGTKIEKVNRIALAWQKLIVKRAVGITFGNPVKYNSQPKDEAETQLLDAIHRVLVESKEGPLNRRAARQIYGLTEVAERWYVTEGDEEHTNYSDTPTKFKIRVVTFSPKYGDELYPYFDDDRNMVAFSRKFMLKDETGKKVNYFETYTADAFYMWVSDAEGKQEGDWQLVEGYPKPNPYHKIPIVYGFQDEPEYADVQTLISRMETMVSNFGDTNDYHSSPKIVVKGHVNSFCKKGEAGAVLELDPDASAEYLTWSQATDAIKSEYDILKEMIHTLTQTPDISWDSVKGVNASGTALKLMFMDAILKVKDKEEVWIDYLTRRVNVIKAILAVIDKNRFEGPARTLNVEPEIVPFIVDDETVRINNILAASGNKQIVSQRSAIEKLGWTNNVDKEMEDIEQEEVASGMIEQNEPTII